MKPHYMRYSAPGSVENARLSLLKWMSGFHDGKRQTVEYCEDVEKDPGGVVLGQPTKVRCALPRIFAP